MSPATRLVSRDWLDALLVILVTLAAVQLPTRLFADSTNIPTTLFSVTSWHTESGLPDGTITAMSQSPDGYLWIGTPRGLARFDGMKFTTFDSKSHGGLLDDNITGLFGDRSGRLWIACESGALLRRENDQFCVVRNRSMDERSSPVGLRGAGRSTHSRSLRATGLADDDEGFVWFELGHSALVRAKGGEAQTITATNGLPSSEVFGLASDGPGQTWMLAGQGLYRWVGGRWEMRKPIGDLRGTQPAFCPARAGGLWIAAPIVGWGAGSGHVIRFDGENFSDPFDETPWEPNLQRRQVTAVLEDRSHRVWLGTHWGGVYFADATGHWRRPCEKEVLDQCRVTALFEDRQGAVWVGTLGDGLYRLVQRPVTTLHLPEPAKDHLINTVCARRDGSVWAGTDGAGVFCYQHGVFKHFGTNEGLANGPVFSILEDSQANLWCGTSSSLMQFVNGRFEVAKGRSAPSRPVLALFEDRSGNLWIGTPAGPVSCKERAVTLHALPGAPFVEIRAFGEDIAGNIWVGTIARGLFCLRTNRIEHFGAAQGLLNEDARSIWCDADGGVWVGTLGGGLFHLVEGKFRALTREDGLPDDTINSILEDRAGTLWLGSYNGCFGVSRELLARYRRGKEPALVCKWLSLAEGLDFRVCSGAGQPIVTRTADGRFWFANQRSIAMFEPEGSWGRNFEPNVVLESVVVDGMPTSQETSEVLRVSSSAKRFEFRFTALHLTRRPEEAHFRCRLSGFDPDWVDAGVNRVAYYGQLRPGRYEFAAMVGSPNGSWHESVRPLQIEIVPRLWERRSVQVAATAALLSLVAATVWSLERNRFRRRLQLAEAQQAMERERQRIARDLHDDLGSDLTEIMLLGELAAAPQATADARRSHADVIAVRSRQAAAAMDEIVWTVNPRNDSVPRLADRVAEIARRLFEPLPVQLHVDIMEDIPTLPLPATARHSLFLAAKEAQTNVAKHSVAGKVRVAVWCERGRVIISVEDNGRGFDAASQNGSRNGLDNMRHRMENIGGTFEIHSQPGRGTQVRLEYPLPDVETPK
jgi:signal transduction histidine kinase/ligand-binding sensor domain-containing protein